MGQRPVATPERAAKVCAHLYLVRRIALAINRAFPNVFPVAEWTNIGAIGLIMAVDQGDDGRNFPALASRAIRAAMLDELRKIYLSRQLERTMPGPVEVAGPRWMQTAEYDEVAEALDALPELEREILRRRLDGYSGAEIAQAIQMTPRQVRAVSERAIGKLRLRSLVARKVAA